MALDQDEAKWVDELVEWLLGLDDKDGHPHHKKVPLHACLGLNLRARAIKPGKMTSIHIKYYWEDRAPTPAKRRVGRDVLLPTERDR